MEPWRIFKIRNPRHPLPLPQRKTKQTDPKTGLYLKKKKSIVVRRSIRKNDHHFLFDINDVWYFAFKLWQPFFDKDFFCKNDFSTHTYIPVPTESGKMLARNIVKKISGRWVYLSFVNVNDFRSIRPDVFLKISQNSQGKASASLFFNKVVGLRLATLFKKRLWRRCFPVNFINIFLYTCFYTHLV